MMILVANLGSTSFKYKLLDASDAYAERGSGAYERIGQPEGDFASHADVITQLTSDLPSTPDAIGFKAVHGGPISGAVRVDAAVLRTMQDFADVAPAHNPVYIAAMNAFAKLMPNVPQVACFETAFHQSIPQSRQVYAIPWAWTESLGIRRYGFHGASHAYIAHRMSELAPQAKKIISCHLGGSCSVCAIDSGRSVANSLGLTPQTGVFHNNRVGDFDIFALGRLKGTGLSQDEILKKLGKEGGLLGISGVSNDLRDVEQAAANGNARAKLAVEAFVESVRGYIGNYLMALGGCDAIVFTGGIGENAATIRQAICANTGFLGIELDAAKSAERKKEQAISTPASRVAVWVVPTNEELIVAKQTHQTLTNEKSAEQTAFN